MPYEAENDGQPRNKDPQDQKEQVDALLETFDQGDGDRAPDQDINPDLNEESATYERTEVEEESEEREQEAQDQDEAEARETEEGAPEPEEEEEKSKEDLRRELEQERERREKIEQRTEEQEEQLESLRKRMDDLAGQAQGAQQPREAEQGSRNASGAEQSEPERLLSPQQEELAEQQDVSREEIIEFAEPDEIEEAMANPQKFMELMTRVYHRARQDTLRDATRVARVAANESLSNKQMIDNFFDSHPELKNHKKFVSHVANEVRAENPDLEDRALLEETAKEAKKQLGIAEGAKKKEEDRRNNSQSNNSESSNSSDEQDPAFADQNKQDRSPSGDGRSDRQQQIDQLIKTA